MLAKLTVPCAGLVTTLYVRVSPSISVAVSVIAFAVSSSVVAVAGLAIGASFMAVTVMLTVAVLESTVLSFTLKVKLSEPL